MEAILKNIDLAFNVSQELKESFANFVQKNPQCLWRSNLNGHLTASALVFDSQSFSRVLLVQHRKLKCWLQPGGHADGMSELLKVAEKELLEETGIEAGLLLEVPFNLNAHIIPEYQNTPAHWHFDFNYLFAADINLPLKISNESEDLKWWNIQDLSLQITDQTVLDLCKKFLAHKPQIVVNQQTQHC